MQGHDESKDTQMAMLSCAGIVPWPELLPSKGIKDKASRYIAY
jgi:hypothetical protein